MQNSGMNPRADIILEWLEQEMGYRSPPAAEAITKICRGNMMPVWKFLLERVKSEKTVDKIRRNIYVHGNNVGDLSGKDTNTEEDRDRDNDVGRLERKISMPGMISDEESSKPVERDRIRPIGKFRTSSSRSLKVKEVKEKEKVANERESDGGDSREKSLQEREEAEKEVARLRQLIERSVKDMKGRMSDLSMEAGERQRVLDEKSNSRHKQVLLEGYDQRCEQAVRILTEYWRRLHNFVEQAREAQRGKTAWPDGIHDSSRFRRDHALYATTLNGDRVADDQYFIETAEERSIRVTCELISANLIEKIRSVFLAYDGDTAKGEGHVEETKLGFEVDGGDGIPEQVKETALNLLRSPPRLLQAMIAYTSRIVAMVNRETEKIDIRADAERLRYRYENNRVSEDVNSVKDKDAVTSQPKIDEQTKACLDLTNRGIFRQLRERQTAHVQQFMATEEMLNLASEAKSTTEELLRRISGAANGGESVLMNGKDPLQNAGGQRQIEMEVWAKERELAGLKSSVDTLTAETQRLKLMCEERKQAKEDLRQKWRKIEEFNARRMELESVYTALIHANMTASLSWEQHMVAARELSTSTIIPVCTTLQNDVNDASDLIEREVAAFQRSPDNRLYLLPAFSQGLLDAMGASNASGPEAVAAVHRNADLLAARAGAGDPSAISSINRINAALQNQSGEGVDAGLVAVVESLQFFFRHKVSSANLLEDLARAVNHMQVLRDLVTSGRMLLSTANSSRPEYERNAAACASTALDQEKIALEQWLPELKAAVQEAQKCLENSKRIRGLVDEWWEQPASTAVDWVTVDGQNVASWLAHVKQLQAAFYEKQLL